MKKQLQNESDRKPMIQIMRYRNLEKGRQVPPSHVA